MMQLRAVVSVLTLLIASVTGLILPRTPSERVPLPPPSRTRTVLCRNTPTTPQPPSLWDRFKSAFENDRDYDVKENPGITTRGGKALASSSRVYPALVVGTTWNVTLSMGGISRNPDPSSDLFAAKIENGVPVTLIVTFLDDGRLAVDEEDNEFTVSGEYGKWQLDADGTTLALAVRCAGLERTVVTKGSLLSVYGGEDTQRTSSSYFVPEGSCLIQTTIIQNESGRLIINTAGAKVLGKDPRNSNAGRWSSQPEWTRTGSVVAAAQMPRAE